jgi:hypothetical protein
MTRFFIGLIGAAIFAAGSLAGQTSLLGGETGCCEQGCPAGCPQGCGNGCCDRCPRCGCCMEPVCHMSCDVKKDTIHKYGCTCKWICLPPVTPACGGCCNQCENSNTSSNCDDCGCCQIRCIHKLVVCPVTKETPIKTCTVLWTCPKCGYGPCCDGAPAPGAGTTQPPPAMPTMPAPAPKEPSRLPPPPKTTDSAPRQPDVVAKRGLQGF